MKILRSINGPLVAADIAVKLGLTGKRETQRRRVRAIIQCLRENGMQIVASLREGYRLTNDDEANKRYLDGKQIGAKRVLGETHRKKKMLFNDRGQGLLFCPGSVTG